MSYFCLRTTANVNHHVLLERTRPLPLLRSSIGGCASVRRRTNPFRLVRREVKFVSKLGLELGLRLGLRAGEKIEYFMIPPTTTRSKEGRFFHVSASSPQVASTEAGVYSVDAKKEGGTEKEESTEEMRPGPRPVSLIRKIQSQLSNGETTAVAVAEAYLDRLEAVEGQLKSFLFVDRKRTLDQAAEVDQLLASGKIPLLAGVPVGVKDNLCTKDMPSTGGSKILSGYCPPYDATAIERLRLSGGVIVGKTNMDEFGMGSSSENSGFQVTSNPWDVERVPGGSSGGSASAVAAGQCAVALGSDTGGSVRLPAAFCGCVGLKPSYGLVSRYGLMSYASSLDVVGCLAQSVEDSAILLSAIAGNDARDSTSVQITVPDFLSGIQRVEELSTRPLEGVRLGVVKETTGEGVDSSVLSQINAAISHFEDLGAIVEEVSLPEFKRGLAAYYILAPSEASSNLSRYDGVRYGPRIDGDSELSQMYCNSRGSGFGKEVKRRILMGTYALSAGYYDAYYKRAQQIRTLIQRDFSHALSRFDALLTPTSPTPAYRKGEKTQDPLAMYVGDLMTVNVNLAGLPALSLPCGLAPGGNFGLPVGLQIIGSPLGEAQILRLGHIFEQTSKNWSYSSAPISPIK